MFFANASDSVMRVLFADASGSVILPCDLIGCRIQTIYRPLPPSTRERGVMALLNRVYFNAVFGAIGGLIGWMLFGVFGHKVVAESFQDYQALLGGALIGGSIGYFVVSVEAIRDRSFLRFFRLATFGLVLGALGGAPGMWVGDLILRGVNAWVLSTGAGAGGSMDRLASVLARGIGWMILGSAVGMSEGIASWSLGKFSYGTVGGALGGFFGGCLFGVAYAQVIAISDSGSGGVAARFWGGLGLVILGAVSVRSPRWYAACFNQRRCASCAAGRKDASIRSKTPRIPSAATSRPISLCSAT